MIKNKLPFVFVHLKKYTFLLILYNKFVVPKDKLSILFDKIKFFYLQWIEYEIFYWNFSLKLTELMIE